LGLLLVYWSRFKEANHSALPIGQVGVALVSLLQQPDLLPKPAQKLTAITFLYDMYKVLYLLLTLLFLFYAKDALFVVLARFSHCYSCRHSKLYV
jgi:hypothetical protein